MVAYDLLSLDKSLPRHQVWSASKARRQIPGLDPCDLRGAALYYDAQATFAERLAVENVVSAAEHGATVEPMPASTDSFRTATGSVASSSPTSWEVGDFYSPPRSSSMLPAPGSTKSSTGTGHAMPRLIGGTKGSHLVVDPFPGAPPTALHYEAREDHRAVLVIPWNGRYLIGTTDIRYEGDLDDVATARRRSTTSLTRRTGSSRTPT